MCVAVSRYLCIPPKISALKVSYQPSSIMHIIIDLNVARGRINHFPTPPPTSAVYYHGDETVSDLTGLMCVSSRQFPSESLLVPAEKRQFWGGSGGGMHSLMGGRQ